MGDVFFYDYGDSSAACIPGFLRLSGWETMLVGDLRDAIWEKSMATFQDFEGIKGPEHLKLWFHDESKPEGTKTEDCRLRSLDVDEELSQVFRANLEPKRKKKVFVTGFDADSWNEPFVFRARSPATGELRLSEKSWTLLRQMWKRLRELSEREYAAGEVVKFPEWDDLRAFHFPKRPMIYIRQSFDQTFADVIDTVVKEEVSLVHLSGVPGIGKSTFLWYVLIRLAVHETYRNSAVVLETRRAYLVFQPDGDVTKHNEKSEKLTDILGEKSSWLLIDQKHEEGGPLGHQIIVFASPDTNNVKHCLKESLRWATLYLRAWTKKEFATLGRMLGQEPEHVKNVWNLCGGSPRMLLEVSPGYSLEKMTRDRVESQNFAMVESMIGTDAEQKGITYSLFRFDVQEGSGSKRKVIFFASSRIAKMYFQFLERKGKEEVLRFVKSTENLTQTGAMRGYIFEKFGISRLHNSEVRMSLRKLQDTGMRDLQQGSAYLNVSKRTVKRYKEIKEMVDCGAKASEHLWLPKKENNAAFDVAVPPGDLIQFTVSVNHPIKREGMRSGIQALVDLEDKVLAERPAHKRQRCEKRFIFVRPPDGAKFGKQNLQDQKGKTVDPYFKILKNVQQYYGELAWDGPTAADVDNSDEDMDDCFDETDDGDEGQGTSAQEVEIDGQKAAVKRPKLGEGAKGG